MTINSCPSSPALDCPHRSFGADPTVECHDDDMMMPIHFIYGDPSPPPLHIPSEAAGSCQERITAVGARLIIS